MQLGPCTQLQRRSVPTSCVRKHRLLIRVRVYAAAATETDFRTKDKKDIRVLVVGSTGYIGKFVVKELINRGYDVVAFAREKSGIGGKASQEETIKEFTGAQVRFGDVTDVKSIEAEGFRDPVDVVVSCLASRTGGKKDSWAIDYQATLNTLEVARKTKAAHFVLLSAICVQRPTLEFQKAKLKFEEALQAAGDITYSIVRPTAFFKSLAGQIENVKSGKPYIMFGDGTLAACKPISEADLASFIADCVEDKANRNKILPIGGPSKAMTALDQGNLLFKLAGREPKFFSVPVAIMDAVIGLFDAVSKLFPNLEDAAEFGRIGRYYATESMLVWDDKQQKYVAEATPGYGKDTLEKFFEDAVLGDGLVGQELGDQAVF